MNARGYERSPACYQPESHSSPPPQPICLAYLPQVVLMTGLAKIQPGWQQSCEAVPPRVRLLGATHIDAQ